MELKLGSETGFITGTVVEGFLQARWHRDCLATSAVFVTVGELGLGTGSTLCCKMRVLGYSANHSSVSLSPEASLPLCLGAPLSLCPSQRMERVPSLVLQVDNEKWDVSCCAYMKNRCFPFTEFLQSSGCVGDGWHQKCSSWCLQEWPLFQADGSSEDCDIFAIKVKMEIPALGTLTVTSFSQ